MGAASAKPMLERPCQHIEDEMGLAIKTGDLTAKRTNFYKGVLSIPASSIESERAFSVASRFVTKIRSRLGDTTLDNFSFAKSKLKNNHLDKLVIFLLILSIISKCNNNFNFVLIFLFCCT